MANTHEVLLYRGNWIIQYDLGATALSASFGSNASKYREIVSILEAAGFVRIQCSIFRHRRGCLLQHAINTVRLIRRLSWARGTSPNGAPHIRSVIISIQIMPYLDVTNFVRGGRLPNIPRF
ncbi:hypothetical protein F8M41_021786 [Gigaspora margarita]|uniref:Uncharacterized protein n=1 Tax=Gigaspora margarita TaxID=4874 RepID=A0A8H4ETL7_GIGMA|nr:hypothetical protein F8M41_021786 [Gigaspora margarita]